MSKNLWFKRKTYGWGWTPASWQGWAAIVVHTTLVLLPLTGTVEWVVPGSTGFFLYEFACVATLITLCILKGEKPRWQWGESKKLK